MKMFVAVVGRVSGVGSNETIVERSRGDNGLWSAVIGTEKDDVVARAVRHAEESSRKHTQYADLYRVFVGELTHEAKSPVKFELVEL